MSDRSKTSWLFAVEPDLSGVENMERDRLMAEACAVDGIPRLRIYSWERPTLSLGFNQKDDRVRRDRIEERGFDLVRRPTGGRAVLHIDEVTYGVAMPTGDRGIHETYGRISSGLALGFARLGAEGVDFSRSSPDFREHYKSRESDGCFTASARNELTFDGRKLVGSAQRRYGDILLQHGSILLVPEHLQIVDLLDLSDDAAAMMRRRLERGTATLAEALGGELPDFDAIAEAICRGMAEEYAVEIEPTTSITRPVVGTTGVSEEIAETETENQL